MTTLQDYLKSNTIDQLKEQYSIDYKFHPEYPNLVQFGYSMIDSPMGEPIVQECRGIILDKNTLEIVSIAFNKFFNIEEGHAAKINWDNAVVQEKLDGSCMTIYYYDSKWHVMTNGSPNAAGNVGDYAFTFAEYFWDTFKKQNLKLPTRTDLCFTFELTGPPNMIVVQHKESKLTLIGVRGKDTVEHDPKLFVDHVNCESVKVYDHTNLQQLIDSFEVTSPLDSEGYVVMDGFKRVKIKNPKYVLWHHLKGKLSPKGILETIITGEKEEFVTYFPDKVDVFNEMEDKLNAYIHKVENEYNKIKGVESIKEFASYAVLQECSAAMFAVKRGKSPSIRKFILGMQVDKVLENINK